MRKFNPQKTKQLSIVNAILNIVYHTPKASCDVDWCNIKRILVIDFTGIGDLIMLIPFLKVLKNNASSACIDLACNRFAPTILENQGLIDDYYVIPNKNYVNDIKRLFVRDKKIRDYIKKIKSNNYDVILEPRGDLRYIYFMHLLNSKRKISYNYTGGESLLTDVVFPDDRIEHLLEDKMFFLKMLKCAFSDEDKIPILSLSERWRIYASEFVRNHTFVGKLIGIHPGASQELRRWDKYPELVERIFKYDSDVTFLVFSAEGEEYYSETVKKKCDEIGCNVIVAKESLDHYISLLSICDMIICNDSGAAHISAALGIPTIVLFGANEPSFSRPIGSNMVISISNEKKCKPCQLSVCRYGSNSCIKSISLNQVYNEYCRMNCILPR